MRSAHFVTAREAAVYVIWRKSVMERDWEEERENEAAVRNRSRNLKRTDVPVYWSSLYGRALLWLATRLQFLDQKSAHTEVTGREREWEREMSVSRSSILLGIWKCCMNAFETSGFRLWILNWLASRSIVNSAEEKRFFARETWNCHVTARKRFRVARNDNPTRGLEFTRCGCEFSFLPRVERIGSLRCNAREWCNDVRL